MEATMKTDKKKSVLKTLLFASIIIFFGTFSGYAQNCGDVNTSGSVDIVDALLIAQYYVGLNPANFNIAAGDVNGSGTVDIVDALVVAQYYVGLPATLACPNQTAAPSETPVVTIAPTSAPTSIPTVGPTIVPGPGPVYSASGGKFYKDGAEIKLYGLNWFGMEGTDKILSGLWTGRQLADFLTDIKSKGFTAFRLPVSPQTINPGYIMTAALPYSGDDCAALCGGKDGRTALEYTLGKMQAAGFYVVPDFHTCNPASLGSGLPGSPYACSGYSQSAWINDLKTLAALSKTYTNIVGIDLCNEPYSMTYVDWAAACSTGGQAVLSVNPNLTIWVEGVGNASASGVAGGANWGQNLYEAGSISGIPNNRLVFSPHSYGPSVAAMSYFADANYPNNMAAIWETMFGYLTGQGFTVIVGEFGGQYTTSSTKSQDDKLWQDTFVSWLISKGMKNSFYWCVNPNSGDTGGMYANDWITWNTGKLALLQRLMN
jgi:endoglucanase